MGNVIDADVVKCHRVLAPFDLEVFSSTCCYETLTLVMLSSLFKGKVSVSHNYLQLGITKIN